MAQSVACVFHFGSFIDPFPFFFLFLFSFFFLIRLLFLVSFLAGLPLSFFLRVWVASFLQVLCNAATSLDPAASNCRHRVPLDASAAPLAVREEEEEAQQQQQDEPDKPLTTTAGPAKSGKRKKSDGASHKPGKMAKILPAASPAQPPAQQLHRRSPCPNVDVRQIPLEHNRPPAGSLLPQVRPSTGPNFFQDPSAYLAQQTVLLQSSLNSQGETPSSAAAAAPNPPAAEQVADEAGEELLGDLLDCIPDSMEEVLDRQKDVAAAAEAAAQAEKAANLIKQAAAAVIQRQPEAAPPVSTAVVVQQQQPKPERPAARSSTKPPPLAIRPATPATAARARAIRAAEPSGSKGTKSKSPRRNGSGSSAHHHHHHQVPIQIQSNAPKVLQPAQPHHQQAQQFWPAISTTTNLGPLRTTSCPFTYHSTVGPSATPIFSTAALRPGNLPMTFLTSTATHPGQQQGHNMFNTQSLPTVLTTRPALAPSGQLVHVLTAPGPILAAAEPSTTTVPILAVGPMSAATGSGSHSGRGLTRTGKKRKSTPQTVASILQQGAQLTAMTQQHPATLTLSQVRLKNAL